MKEKKQRKTVISFESAKILHNLYNTEYIISDSLGNTLEIDQNGSMALLSTGYRGLIALRKHRQDSGFENKNEILSKQTKKNESKK